ncbi:hypothetical protein M9H77_34893 [Catharanthus roseus]|uniref:Uncharacterized protein n=1 Tax=Catharanthus roseus TaxID=4058 RepID=A0ACB9ZMR1_CATRO|nr:hypothetical protein M9H77_34893 [Catharanthus roseus]
MPELVSDDLVMGSGLCLWSLTVTLHVLLNSGHTTLIDGYTKRACSWVDPARLHHHLAQGIELGASIEEDLSEPESDIEMVPEPEEVAPADAKGMGTFVACGSPIAASPIPVLPAESISSFLALPSSLLQGRVREHDICGYCL